MHKDERTQLSTDELQQSKVIGECLARLRVARRVRQGDAALQAGISRPTARKIERGDPGRTLGQLMRYLAVLAPGMTLLQLLDGRETGLVSIGATDLRKRVRERRPVAVPEMSLPAK